MLWLPKLLTYLGLVLALGGLVWGRHLSPDPRRWPVVAGALLVLAGGLAEAGFSLYGVLGAFSPGDYLAYLLGSGQGNWVLARGVAALLLAAVSLQRPRPWWPEAVLSAALLVTVSAAGHARPAGWPWVLLDAAHLAAMGLWVGAVAFLAWRPLARWREEALRPALARASRLALICVGVLALSGTLAALRHLPGLGALWGSNYGATLLVKLALFALALALAALNRWRLMRRPAWRPLALAMRGETLLLALVLAASSVLATSVLPERPLVAVTTPVHLRFAGGAVEGSLRVDQGTLHADLSAHPAPELRLIMLDHPMPTVTVPLEARGDRLVGSADLWMSGHWLVEIAVGGETRRIPVQLQ